MSEKHDIPREELVARLLDGEQTEQDRALLASDPDLAASVDREIAEIRRTRPMLTDAVDSIVVPKNLLVNVQDGIARVEEDRDRRDSNNRFWLYSMVGSLAAALLLWAGYNLFNTSGADAPVLAETPVVVDDGIPIDTLLQVGMTDHMRCAVKNFSGKVPTASMEKMKMGIGEAYEMAVPIITEGIDEADLIVAHRCSFHGREYVHFVLKGENDLLISVAMTKRLPDESLQDRVAAADTTVGDRSIYRTDIDGFEIAGFETADHLVFVASTLSVERNLRAISRIVEPVSAMLEV